MSQKLGGTMEFELTDVVTPLIPVDKMMESFAQHNVAFHGEARLLFESLNYMDLKPEIFKCLTLSAFGFLEPVFVTTAISYALKSPYNLKLCKPQHVYALALKAIKTIDFVPTGQPRTIIVTEPIAHQGTKWLFTLGKVKVYKNVSQVHISTFRYDIPIGANDPMVFVC
jgi:hypothetical protein